MAVSNEKCNGKKTIKTRQSSEVVQEVLQARITQYCNPGGASYEKIKQEKEDWLKSLHLEEDKVL